MRSVLRTGISKELNLSRRLRCTCKRVHGVMPVTCSDRHSANAPGRIRFDSQVLDRRLKAPISREPYSSASPDPSPGPGPKTSRLGKAVGERVRSSRVVVRQHKVIEEWTITRMRDQA